MRGLPTAQRSAAVSWAPRWHAACTATASSTLRHASTVASTDERLQRVRQALGGSTAEEIARRAQKGAFFEQLDAKTDRQWLSTQHHFRKQDRMVEQFGVEGAIRENVQPSTVSFNKELRKRPLDKTVLTECYKQMQGKRTERHLKKGWEWERFVAKDRRSLPVLEAHARAQSIFGIGAAIRTAAQAESAHQFPVSKLPEIAFVGRTNAGKSSLINSVLNNFVAPWGHLPGTTTTANFYRVGDGLMLVDLPGYGFYNTVQSSEAQMMSGIAVMRQYLRSGGRHEQATRNVKRVVLCVSPLGLHREDVKYIEFLEKIGCPFAVVVCKTDTMPVKELARRVDVMRCQLGHYGQAKELMMTSSLRLAGISQLQDRIADMALRGEKALELDEAAIANIV